MKKRDLFVDPDAEQESREAYTWYASKNFAAAVAFENEFRKSINAIVEHPLTYPMFDEPVRRKLMQRFPYGILFTVTDEHIVIVAVMHLHREPGYWQNR